MGWQSWKNPIAHENLSGTERINATKELAKSSFFVASKRSPDGAQRNPGFSSQHNGPRISLRFIRATS